MSLASQLSRVVVYEGSGSEPFDDAERYALIHALLEEGFPVTRAGADRNVPPADDSNVIVVGRFQEPPPANSTTLQWYNVKAGAVAADVAKSVTSQRTPESPQPGTWKPWFPVIDYDRCTNCMQCLSFCLFGVYGADADKNIQVQHQDNCKTNCPACSRVCPEAAIMFPKYKAGPINGDIVSAADLDREKMKIDISALLGGDVYALLRTRNERAQSRFSKERDSDKALIERQKCLAKLAALAADVPPEVLMSLPSPEQIAIKAAEAQAKAKAATDHA